MAKKLFYVCAGMLALALSYHFGAGTAIAQLPGSSVVAAIQGSTSVGSTVTVFAANGDIYVSTNGNSDGTYALMGNVFSGAPVNARQTTWGSVKVQPR